MRAVLPIALITVPLVEIALFVLVGDAIGVWPTLAATVLSALLGAALIRGRSLAALRHMRPGQPPQAMPMAALVNGIAVVAAGLLLIVPGFLTDLLGLSLLVPAVRRLLGRGISRRLDAGRATAAGGGVVIDGEAVVVRDPGDPPAGDPPANGPILMPPPTSPGNTPPRNHS